MKKFFLYGLLICLTLPVSAKHIIGGEMIYQYLGKGTAPNTSKYRIILKLFRDQNSPSDAAAMPFNVYIGIFDNGTNQQYPMADGYFDVSKSVEQAVKVNPFPPCIRNAPSLNYNVGRYVLEVELPDNDSGYTAAYQTCCRVSTIENILNSNGTGAGATYSCIIPPMPDSSPEFSTSIDAICGEKPFSLDFSATDADGDSLVYAFSPAFNGGRFRNAQNANPSPPAYGSVSYTSSYSFAFPLGPDASINRNTGIISGRAPQVGRYVICVSVFSYRNGQLVSEHRKDFIINVTNCDFAGARLNPRPVYCDSFTVSFSNDDYSPLNETFYWVFDTSLANPPTSTLEKPQYTYPDTGTYVFQLVVNRGQQCSDSTYQTLKLYPGFTPDFSVNGKCINSPIFFTDASATSYGAINSWEWDFGDPSTNADSSIGRTPRYNYAQEGNYPVTLRITSTKGCDKTFTDTISIVKQPPLELTNDTLICFVDTLQLGAIGSGLITWSPNYNINNVNSHNPLVSPDVPTTYYARLDESRGCTAIDSVVVDVIRAVSLNMGSDTTICLTDTMLLRPVSNGLLYSWSPTNTLSHGAIKFPQAWPDQNTTYQLTASVGNCSTYGDVTVRTVPYPAASAGNDTAICFEDKVQLLASGGSVYSWTPAAYLDNAQIPNPVSSPQQSIRYVVEVRDALGCPKPAYDTVVIRVEKPFADAGPRDTAIVINQPLQLFATGDAETVLWKPPTGLNSPGIFNPVALLTEDQQYVLQLFTIAGCFASDTIDVRVYKVKPGFYIPNAFTPNNDGLNDDIKPIMFGMRSLEYFNIYNRAGQLIFSTNVINNAWDGTYKGAPQDAAVFVWTAHGVDYMGNEITGKGTITLVR